MTRPDPSRPYASQSGKWWYWKCPVRYVKAGYPVKRKRLSDDETERAQECRDLTRELERWIGGTETTGFGTWAWAIHRYRTDEFSPYQEVKGNTRQGYDYCLDRWNREIGALAIGSLDYAQIKRIEQAMIADGRSRSNIKRMFTMLRIVSNYAGFALMSANAREVAAVLSRMRFKGGAQRQVVATREQILGVVAAADEKGAHAYATGLLMAFELSLRLNDVFGDWIDGAWQDGLTWDMLSADCSIMTKVISKTRGSLAEPYEFDLTLVPGLQARLQAMRPDIAHGPVILRDRRPYTRTERARAWRQFRKAAGVPDDVQMRDSRASGLTEARLLGVSQYDLRDAGQHTQASTTDRYARSRSESANKVIALRQGNT